MINSVGETVKYGDKATVVGPNEILETGRGTSRNSENVLSTGGVEVSPRTS